MRPPWKEAILKCGSSNHSFFFSNGQSPTDKKGVPAAFVQDPRNDVRAVDHLWIGLGCFRLQINRWWLHSRELPRKYEIPLMESFLQWFMHVKWCRTSSINSIIYGKTSFCFLRVWVFFQFWVEDHVKLKNCANVNPPVGPPESYFGFILSLKKFPGRISNKNQRFPKKLELGLLRHLGTDSVTSWHESDGSFVFQRQPNFACRFLVVFQKN